MRPVVELSRISRLYAGPPEIMALHECTLTVYEGDYVTVVGPSGSGKSTLLNLIGLLDTPTSGNLRLKGEDVIAYSEDQRARARGSHIGFVFQSFQLLEQRTCVENVMLSDLYTGNTAKESRRLATAALESVGLGGRENNMPSELSGGQQQRVAIARALAGDPSILLCDEPTGNLDSSTAEKIMGLFDRLNAAGRTILLITHDHAAARRGNRTVAILDGALTERMPESESAV
ncbi:ABC transporter ATP-binding protein [Microbacterium protaetiae]|uniref:ABC transporter ATP-binding protein n=1 Tax=Microbacterium protaetiae TaxID=2509458 RepID=A0A4P6ER95_9MICO|nr:ABC transporter ATP-binding protein [Microbacterium protaetiae]QAY60418.1 ABC transporter ATP-binding protein [Microbacterium protaetiae]